MRVAFAIAGCVALATAPGPAAAQEAPVLQGPALAADSNFGQGWLFDLYRAAVRAGIGDFRDAVYWALTEVEGGRFAYTRPVTRFPDTLAGDGVQMSLVVNNGHPAYDGGHTPHTPAGIAGFARHAAAMVARFPAIRSVEVGNEINSETFVSGPVREAGLDARAEAYVALLAAVHGAVKAQDPDIAVIGGGAHSIAVGWVERVLDAGGAAYMDGLALHPYTTPPEQVGAEMALLRRRPELAAMPVEMTEFGTPDAAAAPHLLMRYYCTFALAGVSRAVWYPLHPRGDGLAPLLSRDGEVTAVGRTFLRLKSTVEGLPVRDVSPDPFTRACAFGDRVLIVWGMPRTVTVDAGLSVETAAGMAPAAPLLSETEPLMIVGEGIAPILGETVLLGPHGVLADSYWQFALAPGGGDGFARLSERGEVRPLVVRPGQERPGTFWTPYLGGADDPWIRLTASQMLPSDGGGSAGAIVHRYVAAADGRADLSVSLEPPARSADGVVLTVRLDGAELVSRRVEGAHRTDVPALALRAGAVLDVVVGPGETARGDLAAYRITLRHSAPAP